MAIIPFNRKPAKVSEGDAQTLWDELRSTPTDERQPIYDRFVLKHGRPAIAISMEGVIESRDP